MQILDQCEKSLSEARAGDKKRIQMLEKELLNCSQEIEGMEVLQDEVVSLREELKRFSSKQFSLIQELGYKEIELEKSALSVEKLEDSISSIVLESQLEVESMKLDMMALEQSLFEAKKIQEETLDENNKLSKSIEELQVALQDAQKVILCLNEENRELKEKLDTANKTSKISSQKDEYWLVNKDRPLLKTQSSLSKQGNNSTIAKDTSTSEVHGPHVGRSVIFLDPAADSKWEMERSQQIQEYECVIKKLKEELREEKSRAKEEAEDLVQEMAELRYQLTNLLEEECKRRACIEHASLQRIAELEAQAGTVLIRPESAVDNDLKASPDVHKINEMAFNFCHVTIFFNLQPKIKVLHLGEIFLHLRHEKESAACNFASMEDDFANCAAHDSIKKMNLVGEDDDLGALRDKDCRADDEALDLVGAIWLSLFLAVWVGGLRKSCDGRGAKVIWIARQLEEIATLMVVAMEVARDGCHGSLQERLRDGMVTLDDLCDMVTLISVTVSVRVRWRRYDFGFCLG
ncbi:hypothetical protein LR48_Vigan01g274700 [Vigna angularis]|uniref:Uncharacterized protein n=1 Tax=Phaseolus angularis TaxID=3914 RepID=A0A0L9TRS7_PHAAN|nr:hypothetical protein LR48_Vigan01g274700 [Vigna angularis]